MSNAARSAKSTTTTNAKPPSSSSSETGVLVIPILFFLATGLSAASPALPLLKDSDTGATTGFNPGATVKLQDFPAATCGDLSSVSTACFYLEIATPVVLLATTSVSGYRFIADLTSRRTLTRLCSASSILSMLLTCTTAGMLVALLINDWCKLGKSFIDSNGFLDAGSILYFLATLFAISGFFAECCTDSLAPVREPKTEPTTNDAAGADGRSSVVSTTVIVAPPSPAAAASSSPASAQQPVGSIDNNTSNSESYDSTDNNNNNNASQMYSANNTTRTGAGSTMGIAIPEPKGWVSSSSRVASALAAPSAAASNVQEGDDEHEEVDVATLHFDENSNPADIGLDPSWRYIGGENRLWWSDEVQLYYDMSSKSYGDPNTGLWCGEDGEWK